MIPDLFGPSATDDVIRDTHHERTTDFIQGHRDELGLSGQEADILKEICLYHRKRENINNCPEALSTGQDDIRVQLLAAYLRLADALHVDETRSDEYLYKIYLMLDMPKEQKFHWVKSRCVQSIVPNADAMDIKVRMLIPEEWDEMRVTPLSDLVLEEIGEELDTVRNVLIRGGVSMFLDVVADIQRIKTIDAEKRKEIEDVLNDIELQRSPNASKIIEVVLDNLLSLCQGESDRALERLIQYEDNLQNSILIQRSCHVGLRNILSSLRTRLRNASEALRGDPAERESVVGFVRQEVLRLRKERGDALNQLKRNALPLLMDGGSILLFGYSDSVLAALEHLSVDTKKAIRVYVCECRNKTRYEHENKLVYSDAIYYALEVHRRGFENVVIVSDCTVANLFSRGRIDKVLFGANGVDREFHVGHTVGHLMVADLASVYGVPVFVLVELLKFGDFEHKPDLQRDNNWLTTMRGFDDLLLKCKIETVNFREDVVPCERVTFFVTDVGVFTPHSIKRIREGRSPV